MSITDDIHLITNESPAPPNMPPNLREARQMAHWAPITFLVMAVLIALGGIVYILLGVLSLVSYGGGIFNMILGIIYFVLAFLAFYAAIQVKKKVIPMLDMGNVKGAKDESVKWLIVGLFTGFIPFIFMLLAYLKLDESPQPQPYAQGPYPQPQQQYQQAPPGYAQQPAPQSYQAPPRGYPPQNYPAQQPQNPPQAQNYQAPPQQVPPQQAPQNQMPPQAPPSQNYAPPQPQSPPPSGVPPQVMRCPNCGAELQPGMTQCPNCGAMLR